MIDYLPKDKESFFDCWRYILKYQGFGWYLFWGQRGNGKTYSLIDGAMLRGLKIAYIRRYDTDLMNPDLIKLFQTDHNIKKITANEYEYITVKTGKQICFCNYDKNGKIAECSEPIAQCFALNKWERYKGADRGTFDIIIFDEFMTGKELPDEYVCFKNMLSTLLRNRDKAIIVMLANSFNPFSVYFDELCVNDIVQGMTQGESETATFDETKILLHYCVQTKITEKVNRKFFGFDKGKTRTQMIEGGSWQIDDYPHCTLPYINKPTEDGGNVIVYMYVTFRSKFMVLKIVNIEKIPIFIHAHFCKDIPQKAKFIFTPLSDIYTDKTYHTIDNFMYNNKRLGKILERCLKSNRIYFTNNMEGEFFKTWYNAQRLKRFIV